MAEADNATIDPLVRSVPSAFLQRAVTLIDTMLDKHSLGADAIVSSHTDFGTRQRS